MSAMNLDQITAAQKAQIDTFFGLGHTAFDSVEKLVELNLQATKSAFAEAADTARAALSVKDMQEWVALQQAMFQPAAEKAAAYGRHVYEIASAANAEVVRVTEAQVADVQQKFFSAVDTAVKNAPAGSESVVALVKSAVQAANNAIETAQKAAKQAAGVAEANFQALSKNAVAAATKAPVRAKRGA